MESFLGGVARALKPGARFVIETGMAAESAIPKFEELASHQIEVNILLTIKESSIWRKRAASTPNMFLSATASVSRGPWPESMDLHGRGDPADA